MKRELFIIECVPGYLVGYENDGKKRWCTNTLQEALDIIKEELSNEA